jgi:hypothetical protein
MSRKKFRSNLISGSACTVYAREHCIFRCQTHFRNDGKDPEWILRPTFNQKGLSGHMPENTIFSRYLFRHIFFILYRNWFYSGVYFQICLYIRHQYSMNQYDFKVQIKRPPKSKSPQVNLMGIKTPCIPMFNSARLTLTLHLTQVCVGAS